MARDPKTSEEGGTLETAGRLALRQAKRMVVVIVGGTVLLLGIALLVLPGPAFVVIPMGLAILAIEFEWARRWLRRLRGLLPVRGARSPASHQRTGESPGAHDAPSARG